VFRVQGNIPNMAICPNIVRKCYLQISLFILHFSAIFSEFLFLFLYLDMDPEHSPFNMATENIIYIFGDLSSDYLIILQLVSIIRYLP
jgi:hypothetical protein